jgi:hypothetical protein
MVRQGKVYHMVIATVSLLMVAILISSVVLFIRTWTANTVEIEEDPWFPFIDDDGDLTRGR